VVKTPCATCKGHGAVEKQRKVMVTFPAGIDGGQRLRVPGQGMPGHQGGPPGDLYVDIELAPDERFERDGADLVTRANVSFVDAAMGASIQLQLPDETAITVDVPAGTQPGEVVTLKGKGLPRLDGRGEGRGRGALQVVVQVEVPRGLSSRAKELLRELDGELTRGREKIKTA
jgi:molecular chaperone DnaJ